MSINLNFWKYEAGADHNHAYVYEKACSDGELVEGLERLPITKIREDRFCLFRLDRPGEKHL